jgi:prepilin-type N-terminal cleavage/methylation domain-containing protein
MNNRGVTLAELLIVLSIISILAVALGFSFQGWMGNYKVESQVKQLYSDLMNARALAMTRNRMHFVILNANDYSIYEDTNDNNAANPGSGDNPIPEYRVSGTLTVKPKTLQYSLGWTGTIAFDTRGLSSSASVITIPLTGLSSGVNADYDCILVYQSRVQMGKYAGTTCSPK